MDIATRLFFASLHADAEHHSLYFPTIVYHDAEHTLGHDRILALCGARSLTQEACLVVDAGTCITADYMSSDGLFAGGAIMASPEMQLHAMHSYTAHLPLPDIDYQHRYASPCGTSTASAMLAGTVATTAMALRAVADYYQRQHSTPVRILCTGGDGWFISQMVDGAQYIDNLVFRGMAMIGRHAMAGTAQH